MVPPLAALSAPSAAAVMGFRGRTLDMAKRNAGLYGFQGAHYPWETAPNDGTYTRAHYSFVLCLCCFCDSVSHAFGCAN